MKIKIKLPATTANLGPGFDCLGVALSLYNEFEINVVESKVSLKVVVEGVDSEHVPLDERNHVYVGIKKIFEKAKMRIPSIEIHIKNNIPLQRGLGSSATAYVAGVVAGNILCGEPFSEYDVLRFAVELEGHPDNVIPCMYGGFCISNVIDGKPKFIKLQAPKDIVALVIIPDKKVSTKKAREILPKNVKFEDAVKNVCNVAMLIGSFVSKKYEFLKFATEDCLHQPYRAKIMPWMYKVFNLCLEEKALCCMLSGSGSSIVSFYKKSAFSEDIAEKIRLKLSKFVDCEYKILSFSNQGLSVRF